VVGNLKNLLQEVSRHRQLSGASGNRWCGSSG